MLSHSTFLSLLFALSAFFLEACGTTEPPSTRNTMTAIVNSANWSAVEVMARRGNDRLFIEGTSAIESRLILNLRGDSVGTYQLGAILHEGIFTDESEQWVAYGVHSGSVTVTSIDDTHVAGYFGFRAQDTIGTRESREIAGGTFDIDFTP